MNGLSLILMVYHWFRLDVLYVILISTLSFSFIGKHSAKEQFSDHQLFLISKVNYYIGAIVKG